MIYTYLHFSCFEDLFPGRAYFRRWLLATLTPACARAGGVDAVARHRRHLQIFYDSGLVPGQYLSVVVLCSTPAGPQLLLLSRERLTWQSPHGQGILNGLLLLPHACGSHYRHRIRWKVTKPDVMAIQNNASSRGNERDLTMNQAEQQSTIPNDLPDSAADQERLRPEEYTIDLPDVSDIPGQEFVHSPEMGMLADTTISSEDEEGDRVFGNRDEEEELDFVMGTEGDVNPAEKRALEDDDYLPTPDENRLRRASLDSTDFQDEPLNEGSFGDERSGGDLDMPISGTDDRAERIGERIGAEDEENNAYSLGSDDNDNITEGTP